jgi:hypothetical protein
MRLRVPTVVVAVLTLVLAPGASAVGTFGAAHQVGPSGCLRLVSAKASDGVTHGYLGCRSGSYYVEGSGSSWRTTKAAGVALAVAVGGTSTFSVVGSDSAGLSVTRRTPAGTTSTQQITKGPVRTQQGVSITASGSKWWAVWSVETGSGGYNLWEAHTLGGTVKAHRIFGSTTFLDFYPSIAYQPSTGTAVLVWSSGASGGQLKTVLATSHGGAWSSPRVVDPDGDGPIVALDGGTVVVANTHGQPGCHCYVGVFTGTTSGPFTRHVLQLQSLAPKAMDVSRGKVTVAYQARDRTTGYTQIIRVAERSGSRWTETSLSTNPLDDLLDVQSFGGSARLFYKNRVGVFVRSQQGPSAPRTPSASPKASPVAKPVVTPTATPSPTAVPTTAAPTPSPSATPSPVQAEKAGESGPNLLVRGGGTLVLLVLIGGIVALLRRRRA